MTRCGAAVLDGERTSPFRSATQTWGADAGQQAAALAERAAAAHVPLDDPYGVAFLLARLREADAAQQAAALAARLPAAGKFGLFLGQEGIADQFHFGQEPDGTPAVPWDWEDLDLRGPAPQPRRSRKGKCGAARMSVRGSPAGYP